MILNCPSCNSKYVVSPNAIGKVGRIVRCAQCGHSWFQSAPEEAPKPEPVAMPDGEAAPKQPKLEREHQRPRPIPEGSGLPVPSKGLPPPAQLKIAAIGLFVAVLLAGLFVFRSPIVSMIPTMQGLYAALGMEKTQGIALANVTYTLKPTPKKTSLLQLEGMLINESDHEIAIPLVRFRFVDENGDTAVDDEGRPIDAKEMDGKGKILKAGESMPFTTKLEGRFQKTSNLQIDLGSGYEMWMRD